MIITRDKVFQGIRWSFWPLVGFLGMLTALALAAGLFSAPFWMLLTLLFVFYLPSTVGSFAIWLLILGLYWLLQLPQPVADHPLTLLQTQPLPWWFWYGLGAGALYWAFKLFQNLDEQLLLPKAGPPEWASELLNKIRYPEISNFRIPLKLIIPAASLTALVSGFWQLHTHYPLLSIVFAIPLAIVIELANRKYQRWPDLPLSGVLTAFLVLDSFGAPVIAGLIVGLSGALRSVITPERPRPSQQYSTLLAGSAVMLFCSLDTSWWLLRQQDISIESPYDNTRTFVHTLAASSVRRIGWQLGIVSLPGLQTIPAGRLPIELSDSQTTSGKANISLFRTLHSFQIGNTEVTFDMYDYYRWFMQQETGVDPGRLSDQGWGRLHRPVIYVDWLAANNYVNWLSSVTGQQCRLPLGASLLKDSANALA